VWGNPKLANTLVSGNPVIAVTLLPPRVRTMSPRAQGSLRNAQVAREGGLAPVRCLNEFESCTGC
jgi:hypothetical protein